MHRMKEQKSMRHGPGEINLKGRNRSILREKQSQGEGPGDSRRPEKRSAGVGERPHMHGRLLASLKSFYNTVTRIKGQKSGGTKSEINYRVITGGGKKGFAQTGQLRKKSGMWGTASTRKGKKA